MEDIKLIRQTFIEHAKEDKFNFASLITLNSKTQESISLMMKDISYIKDDLAEIKMKMDSKYVSKEEFDPIKKLVYGMTGLILTGFVIALIALVIK